MTSEHGDGDSEYGGRELEIRHKDAPCLTFCKRPSPFDGRIATESIVVKTLLIYPFHWELQWMMEPSSVRFETAESEHQISVSVTILSVIAHFLHSDHFYLPSLKSDQRAC